MIILVITATSNAVNLTDGLDGLAIGTISIAFISARAYQLRSPTMFVMAKYLSITHLPGAAKLTVFSAAIIGAGLGFWWYNAYPRKYSWATPVRLRSAALWER